MQTVSGTVLEFRFVPDVIAKDDTVAPRYNEVSQYRKKCSS